MLTIQECRKYLDAETGKALSDKEIEAVRDDLYALARIVLDTVKQNGYGDTNRADN